MEKQMTGKDLILYILKNDLENTPVFDNGRFLMFMSVRETAARLNAGPTMVEVWVERGKLPHVKIGDQILIPHDVYPKFRGAEHV